MNTPTDQAELVIATQNPGKIAEIRALLAAVPVRVIGLDDAGGPFDEPPETGRTFEANAALKAMAYADLTGRMCLADDSGLEIDALQGRPGVDSAWYAYETESQAKAVPREIRDPRNIERVMAELEGVPAAQRSARFVCCMALAAPIRMTDFPSLQDQLDADSGTDSKYTARLLATARATFEGRIGLPPRVPAGCNGFGYDPVFLAGPDHARTSAELLPSEKNAVSHRARALHSMIEYLQNTINSQID